MNPKKSSRPGKRKRNKSVGKQPQRRKIVRRSHQLQEIYWFVVLVLAVAIATNYQKFDLNLNWNLNRDFFAAFPTNPNSDLGQDWKRKLERTHSAKNIVAGDRDYQNRNFQTSDRYVASLNYRGTSVSELADLLSQVTLTDAEKARAIYVWLAHNIRYDVDGFYNGDYGDESPQSVLKTRKAVCSGYANLYQALARQMDLKTVIVSGYAKGIGYLTGNLQRPNHAWNAVKIGDGWYLVDATWGAGYVKGNTFHQKFNNFYFATPPDQLIYTHFPEKESWQLLDTPYNKQQFRNFPDLSYQFFQTHLKILSQTYLPSGEFKLVLQAPTNIDILAVVKSGSQELPRKYVQIHRNQHQMTIVANYPKTGNFKLHVFAKNKNQPGNSYPHAASFSLQTNK